MPCIRNRFHEEHYADLQQSGRQVLFFITDLSDHICLQVPKYDNIIY